ncbi:hypothetical protein AVR91_0204175 [Amycolatopsis keratiniphila subsp. keratiniphila]|uniref:Uncharacterized protein n=1 Tax=Amycolatopsis keratiniphila subsp. keratiniphila TaxID=227715 RepID=A0A1W2M2Q5_9PSEU|nr:hypothetical protein AVR91_0204175 [Amycolatopsis keratiniphila subsp. keratiniphila]
MNADAIVWALTVEPPGAAELGLLVHLSRRVGDDFAVELSLNNEAKKLHSTTGTLSRALNNLARADLVTVEKLDKVHGVYEAGRGKVVRLNHPNAPHMSPEQVAERAEDRRRRAELRASLPEEVWEALKPSRTKRGHADDEDATPSAPMISRRERGGLRLLTAGPSPTPTARPDSPPDQRAVR